MTYVHGANYVNHSLLLTLRCPASPVALNVILLCDVRMKYITRVTAQESSDQNGNVSPGAA